VAIRAQDADVIGRIILPIAVDVLDFKGHLASKWVAFIPTAALTFLSDCLNNVASHRTVEV
jgi:hypothetical protein